MNNKTLLRLGKRSLGIAKVTVFLYPDFQLKFWKENSPNVFPNGKHLSLGWFTISIRE